jgi:hypothetical protein
MNNITYENGKIVQEHSEEDLDIEILRLEARIAKDEAALATLQAIKDSIV